MAVENPIPASANRAAATRARIMDAGQQLFAERGYAASSMRQLAERAGVSLSASYYYFPGKHDVLVAIMERAMQQLEGPAREVMDAGLDPLERLAELLRTHVRVHLAEPDAARVADGELRSLTPRARRRIVALRDRYERYFRSTLAEGIEAGVFSAGLNIPVTAIAIITMATATVDWWRPDGPLSAAETAAALSDLAVAIAVHGGQLAPAAGGERTGAAGRSVARRAGRG